MTTRELGQPEHPNEPEERAQDAWRSARSHFYVAASAYWTWRSGMRRPRERSTFGAMPTQAAFADRLADASKAIAYLAASKPSADTSALRDHRAQLERVAYRCSYPRHY